MKFRLNRLFSSFIRSSVCFVDEVDQMGVDEVDQIGVDQMGLE
jgi:hypothetical protein